MSTQLRIHFLAGLPRSGSTLLAAILRQNPRFHASIQTPVTEIFSSLMKCMSGANDSAIFISSEQRVRILRSIFHAYYADLSTDKVIFDNNRGWSLHLPALVQLFPQCRLICCVRNPAWILDSIERHVQQNALQPSRLFNYEPSGSVYSRAEQMMKSQLVGPSLNALRQAWFGDYADRVIAVRYSSFTERPEETISQLYSLLGETLFRHDFDHVEYESSEFDGRLGLPGFHRVAPRVEVRKRQTILPVDLFRQYDHSFWELPGHNPRSVPIL